MLKGFNAKGLIEGSCHANDSFQLCGVEELRLEADFFHFLIFRPDDFYGCLEEEAVDLIDENKCLLRPLLEDIAEPLETDIGVARLVIAEAEVDAVSLFCKLGKEVTGRSDDHVQACLAPQG